MSSFQPYGKFRQIDRVEKATRFLLYVYAALSIISIASGVFEYQLLDEFERGVYTDQAAAIADAESNDIRQLVISVAQGILYLTTVVFFLVWTYRVAWNARELDSNVMKIRPGWAVGWYFIPIATLWMPHRAISQVWTASSGSRIKGFIGWWWLFFIADNIISSVVSKTLLDAETLPALKNVTIGFIISDVVSSVAALLCARVVARVSASQIAAMATGDWRQGPDHRTETPQPTQSVPNVFQSDQP